MLLFPQEALRLRGPQALTNFPVTDYTPLQRRVPTPKRKVAPDTHLETEPEAEGGPAPSGWGRKRPRGFSTPRTSTDTMPPHPAPQRRTAPVDAAPQAMEVERATAPVVLAMPDAHVNVKVAPADLAKFSFMPQLDSAKVVAAVVDGATPSSSSSDTGSHHVHVLQAPQPAGEQPAGAL